MDVMKLFRIHPRTADRIFVAESIVCLGLFVVSLIRENHALVIMFGVTLFILLGRRLFKGPSVGHALLEIGQEIIKFNDLVIIGKVEFRLVDVREIRVVGPLSRRRIRVHTKTGSVKDVYWGLRGKRLELVVDFLRKNLPSSIILYEDEPPTWQAAIRGDF